MNIELIQGLFSKEMQGPSFPLLLRNNNITRVMDRLRNESMRPKVHLSRESSQNVSAFSLCSKKDMAIWLAQNDF